MPQERRAARRGRAALPSMTTLLSAAAGDPRLAGAPSKLLAETLSAVVADVRARLAGEDGVPAAAEFLDRAAERLAARERLRLTRVINATGVVLHTNLGRAPLSQAAIDAIAATAGGYCNLELDLESGERGRRGTGLEALLRELTGCEAAVVVNNNAAATLLVLAELAAGKEVIVSRGQLIEIGGSYRLPEVMAAGGAVLREVGTTNKTRLSDYRDAINMRTGVIMRVHTSNYRITGFAETPSAAELAALAGENGIPFFDDLGSGAMIDDPAWRAAGEPIVGDSIAAGADIVSFSGDKLLGGPQAGIILGRNRLIERIRRHPLARAVRIDKLTVAALQATLELYRSPTKAERQIPVLAMLRTNLHELQQRAEALASRLRAACGRDPIEVDREESFAGGGSLPAWPMPSCVVRWRPGERTAGEAARRLRHASPPVIVRIRADAVLFDVRSLSGEDVDAIPAAVAGLAQKERSRPRTARSGS